MISDTDLAWRLADEAAQCLNRFQRALVFVELGSGEYISAIERVLAAAAPMQMPLSPNVLAAVAEWLDRYNGYAHEGRLRPLLARIPARLPAE
jgi:hypothetical protein